MQVQACDSNIVTRIFERLLRKHSKPAPKPKPISAVRKQKNSAYNARDEFNITTDWNMLPKAKTEKLNEVERFIPNSGTNENFFYRGKYKVRGGEERKVFIKTRDDDMFDPYADQHMLNEARHYYLMDMLGLGPKYHGAVKINGKWGIVVDDVPGTVVKWGNNPELRQLGIKIHPSAIRDIRLAGSRLDQAGIHNPVDMQFIISPDGRKATLIDPEHFKAVGPDNGAQQAAEAVIDSLKGYLVD